MGNGISALRMGCASNQVGAAGEFGIFGTLGSFSRLYLLGLGHSRCPTEFYPQGDHIARVAKKLCLPVPCNKKSSVYLT